MSDEMRVGSKAVLPVHGFVLAGGKSSRMGRDKATLLFCGRPMVEIALEKLRETCAEISIAGNRQDLSVFAAVVPESRVGMGPAAGIEAGLIVCRQAWAMFMPVDVPIIPPWLLRAWVEDVIEGAGVGTSGSYLEAEGGPEPVFCILRPEILPVWTEMLNQGQRSLKNLLERSQAPGRCTACGVAAAKYAPRATPLQMRSWFRNVNTPQELAEIRRDYKTALPHGINEVPVGDGM